MVTFRLLLALPFYVIGSILIVPGSLFYRIGAKIEFWTVDHWKPDPSEVLGPGHPLYSPRETRQPPS